jgi:hypothetical protein
MNMAQKERVARIDSIGLDGRFEMTLVTEGEASDGDILSIAGGQIPKRMPMLISHFNDPTATAGSVTEAKKMLGDTPPRLRAVGTIELGGEGALAEVRRDIAYMIGKGHVQGVSVRWEEVDGKPPLRRVNLPSDHPYFVNPETEKNWRKRNGFFWSHWRAMEGSIVALGADPKALIGRSAETVGEVSTFWRAMAGDAEAEFKDARLSGMLSALRVDALRCREAGADLVDLFNAASDEGGSEEASDLEPVEVAGRKFFLPAAVAEGLAQRKDSPEPIAVPVVAPVAQEPTGPTPSRLTMTAADLFREANVDALASLLSKSMDDYEKRIKSMTQVIVDQWTGRLPNG